jgi:hypothetical protein
LEVADDVVAQKMVFGFFVIVLPIWLIPAICFLAFPDVLPVISFGLGLIFALIDVGVFWAVRYAKIFGIRFVIALLITCSLAGLLLWFLSKLF